jgi:hypothetical protein
MMATFTSCAAEPAIPTWSSAQTRSREVDRRVRTAYACIAGQIGRPGPDLDPGTGHPRPASASRSKSWMTHCDRDDSLRPEIRAGDLNGCERCRAHLLHLATGARLIAAMIDALGTAASALEATQPPAG